jgi:tRNA G18 (ribose-2'-O)-methylase SpoU
VDQDATEGEEAEFVDTDSMEVLMEVGVGPWEGDPPVGSLWDSDLLVNGDRRNVIDKYRYWTMEAIVADLDTSRHTLHIAIENLEHDFNIGSIVRTANAFLVKEVHIVGRKRWNRRGAMVTDKYQHIHHHTDPAAFGAWALEARIPVIGVDNMDGSIPIETFDYPKECVLVVGQEGSGLSDGMRAQCQTLVDIAQFGSTRSINVGAAAAIAMHGWIRQHAIR